MNSSFMQRALNLSKLGSPSPNPFVGCVIVKKENGIYKIIGEGYHHKAGEDHAEVMALKAAQARGHSLEGAEMYVTLEPCCHRGKTPPCVKAIIREKIRKVYIAVIDQNPLVQGQGIKALEKAGIEVHKGLLEFEARAINRFFFTWIQTGKPFVTIKAAVTREGFIADLSGKRKWISNKQSRRYAHQLRSRYDAVLVGINTVLQDDPRLTARITKGRDPLRIIVDSTLKIPLDAKVLADKHCIIATAGDHDDDNKKKELEKKGIECLSLGKEGNGDPPKVNLFGLLQELGKRNITSVLVEGGSKINASFLREGLVDSFILVKTPTTFSEVVSLADGYTLDELYTIVSFQELMKFGEDVVMEGYAT